MAEKTEVGKQVHTQENTTQTVHKKFQIPSIEEVVASIKDLDDSIQHVSLNLIKANFNATEDDVKKTFPEYKTKFLKVKQYKPGSFEVVFPTRMDAIQFTRNAPGKKILGRIFLIKMGRNFKDDREDWVYVEGGGHEKKKPYHKNRNYQQPKNLKHKEGEQVKTQEKTLTGQKQTEVVKKEQKVAHKEEQKKLQKRTIETKQYQKPKVQRTRDQTNVKEQKQIKHPQIKESTEYKPYGFHKGTQPQPKVATETKPEVQKPAPKTADTKEQPKASEKTAKPKAQVKQTKQEKQKEEDDGWVVVKRKGKK